MYNRKEYKNRIQAMYDENNHITTRDLLDLIEEARDVGSTERALIDEICDEVRIHTFHKVDEFLEDAKQNRESDPRSYERAIQIRKGCEDLPMNSHELDELMTSIRSRAIINIALLELSGVVAVGATDNYTNRVGMRKIPPHTMYVSVRGGDIDEIAQTIFDTIWYYNTWGDTTGSAIDEDGEKVLVRFDYEEYVPQSTKRPEVSNDPS